MDISFNTHDEHPGVALQALQLYKSGNYKEAIPALTNILDTEPSNWDARLFLGACYYKTGQFLTAQRIFRYTSEVCTDSTLRARALEALRATNANLDKSTIDLPPEFGCYVLHGSKAAQLTWMDRV